MSNRSRRGHAVRPIHLLLADERGRFFDHPRLLAAGASWDTPEPLGREKKPIPLPAGAQVVFLPGWRPVGIDPENGRAEVLERFTLDGETFRPHAVAAVLPPGHLRWLLPAGHPEPDAVSLPLRGYTAVGLRGQSVRVAAERIDPHTHWDPARFERTDYPQLIEEFERRLPGNAIVRQLRRCAIEYGCCTARNLFLGTFEAAAPVAPRCPARCLGCISEQTDGAGASPAPQARLAAPPTVEEIAALAVLHLEAAEPAMVSFGQGCEGEPLTEGERIAAALTLIRSRTRRGRLHLNTNGCRPELVPQLAAAGLDSVRVSLFSARAEMFAAYHRADFGLATVERFLAACVEHGLYTAINLLVFPGFTDRPEELEALLAILQRTGAQMVQLRNLDLDPRRLLGALPAPARRPLGLVRWLLELHRAAPALDVGSFNRLEQHGRASKIEQQKIDSHS